MILSVLILVFSGALFFFYIQTFCEKALRRKFTQPYFKDIVEAIPLEYPLLLNRPASDTSLDHSHTRSALRYDFMILEYLLRNSGAGHWNLPRRERILVLYFRFLLFSLPIRHAVNLREGEVILKLAKILQFFANLLGEKLSIHPLGCAPSDSEA